jgi:hypothetical protein
MASKKSKVTLTIDKAVWDHFKTVSDRINVSASGLIEEWMRLQAPSLERVATALESGEPQQVFNVGYVEMGKLFAEMDSLRRISEEKSEVTNPAKTKK